MTHEQKTAMEWLDTWEVNFHSATVIKAMLARQENPDLRAAISALRGWSAEAAGRGGLAASVLIVCNAAESTLPVQMYRIRAKGLDVVHAGPVSISEVP